MNMKIISRIFKLVVSFSPFFTFCIFLIGTIQALGNGFVVLQTQRMFDVVSYALGNQASIQQALNSIIILFGIIIAIQLLNGLQNYLYDVYIHLMKNKLGNYLSEKSAFIEPICYEDPAFLNLQNKAKQGMNNCIELVLVFGDIFTFYLPYFLFMLVYLMRINKSFGLFIVFIFIPVLLSQIIRIKLFSKLEDNIAQARRQQEFFDSCISEKVYVKETRSLNASSFFVKKLQSVLKNINKMETKTNLKMNSIEVILDLITLIGYISIIITLFVSFRNHAISLGVFVAIYTSIRKVFNMMEEIIRYHIGGIAENIGSIKNFIALIDFKDMAVNNETTEFESIELKNVSFRYPGGSDILKNIHLKIDKNQKVAIVGNNGSGKTTLSKILLGLYLPTSGTTLVNGEISTMRKIKKTALFQNFQKYKMTLSENIRISDLSNDEYIEPLCEYFNLQLNLSSIILSPEFDGIDLSIGEWQRISMARAFFKSADFVIMDEPTASIDPIEENNFYIKFKNICEFKTSVIITHHLASCKYSDLIIMLEAGEIIEYGTHEALMNKQGQYFKLFSSQKSAYENKN